jgi:hypothetical protein
MMMMVVVPPMGNTSEKKSLALKPLKMMMIEVKVASLKTVIPLKYLQLNHNVNLNYHSYLNYLH